MIYGLNRAFIVMMRISSVVFIAFVLHAPLVAKANPLRACWSALVKSINPPRAPGALDGANLPELRWQKTSFGWIGQAASVDWGAISLVFNDNYLSMSVSPLPGDLHLSEIVFAQLKSKFPELRRKDLKNEPIMPGDEDLFRHNQDKYALVVERKDFRSREEYEEGARGLLLRFLVELPRDIRRGSAGN